MDKVPFIVFCLSVLFLREGFLVQGASIQGRIVNGEVAAAGEFPWQVSLRGPSHFCGGTLLSDQHVLTAAHCVDGRDAANITVVTGTTSLESSGEEHAVRTIFVHASYSSPEAAYHLNDVSLLILDAPIIESPLQQRIALPAEDVPNGAEVVVSGWGRTSVANNTLSTELQKMNVTILNSTECQSQWGETVIQADHLCTVQANNSGICYGDSGSGLIYTDEYNIVRVVGIVSWANPCALGYPDVYTRVYNHIFWIGSRVHNVELMTTVLPDTTTPENGQHSLTHGNSVILILSLFTVVQKLIFNNCN